jgi:di/tricarboxylate transporter
VQGPDEQLEALRNVGHLMLLTGQVGLPRSPLAPWALGIMAAVVVVAATKLLPIHVAAFIGVIAMLAKGCVKLHGVGRALSLQVVLLVVSSIALGQALVETGAADWVAGGVVVVVQNLPPTFQLVAFMTFGAVLTNFVSNSAAAAVGTPIAVATASQLGSPLEPFVLSILFGANLSYATPMAYQTNVLVMNAAGYTFGDFVRVGVPLVLLMLVTLSVLLVRNYGL